MIDIGVATYAPSLYAVPLVRMRYAVGEMLCGPMFTRQTAGFVEVHKQI